MALTDSSFPWKYNEDELTTILEYIKSTYGAHYIGDNDIQTIDFIHSLGEAPAFCRGSAIKYLARYGKKEGLNQKDLYKAIHYIVLLLHFSKENQNKKGENKNEIK